MTVPIHIWSDYVCPYCFLAEQPLADAIAASGVEAHIRWMPFELRPEPTPTLRPEENYLQSGWAQSVYPLAEKMGTEIRLPDVSPQPYSRLAFEGHLFAEANALSYEYTHRMFTAFFRESHDIGDIEVLTSLAEEIGLAATTFRKALYEGTYAEMHQALLKQARDVVQITAVPSFLIGNRLLRGLAEKDALVSLLQTVGAEATP